MSFADYSSLRTAIGNWLHRADMEQVIPDLITLAETRFNRSLRVRQMEKRLVVPLTQNFIDLPGDWLGFSQAPFTDAPLGFLPRDRYDARYGVRDYGHYYTLIGNQLWVGTSGLGDFRMDYYSKIPSLSKGDTNWLLEDAPDVYLYGALLEAEPWLKNDARIEVWRGFLQTALIDLQTSNDIARYSGGDLVIGTPR